MKKTTLLLTLLALSACGFHPVYGVNRYTAVGVEDKLAAISIQNIPNREGQYLRNALIDRFYRDGRPQSPRYALSLDPIEESKTDLDITKNSDATRGQLRLQTTMHLQDIDTGKILLERELQTISSYNILSSEFTNGVSEQNTRENALDDLARQVEQQIGLVFKKDDLKNAE